MGIGISPYIKLSLRTFEGTKRFDLALVLQYVCLLQSSKNFTLTSSTILDDNFLAKPSIFQGVNVHQAKKQWNCITTLSIIFRLLPFASFKRLQYESKLTNELSTLFKNIGGTDPLSFYWLSRSCFINYFLYIWQK